MLKVILAFTLADLFLSLISIKIPIFRRHTRLWQEETNLQRFCSTFFPPWIAFVLLTAFSSYKDAHSPSTVEKMLINDEAEYYFIYDWDEADGADAVYEIKKNTSQEQICKIISSICQEINKGSNTVYSYYENGKYVIMDNGITIGSVTVSEKKYGTLLKFVWAKLKLGMRKQVRGLRPLPRSFFIFKITGSMLRLMIIYYLVI